MRVVTAASVYFLIVFAAGFVFGAIRVTALTPTLGAVIAVLIELPLILAVSWFACRWVLSRWPVRVAASEDIAMGALAFALLMAAEAALTVTLAGRPLGDFFMRMATPEGMIGLLGQIAFAALPVFQSRIGRSQ
jgi:hypothetical protein